jgi:predicted dehydrogenase
MVGGGPGAFIGAVHRNAAALDGGIELVAGAFSSDPAKSKLQGQELGLDPNRVYDSYQQMAIAEAALPENERINFVSIVTPNNSHYPIAKTFANAGFHIVCDKPLTTNLEDAFALRRAVLDSGVVFALTHNYTGYPLVKHARHMVSTGEIGDVRKVVVEYPQGWLSAPIENDGQKQASWRTDPKIAGAGALGDIGSHAENLVRYITGLQLDSICADVSSIVAGRSIDDDVNILVHYPGGARGIIYCSQISVGEENGLRVRIYGSRLGIEWRQEEPNSLIVRSQTEPLRILRAGQDYLSPVALHNTRLPAGHPEGFIEAFANVYRNATRTMIAKDQGSDPEEFDLDFPGIDDGVLGMHFIETSLQSGQARGWVDAKIELD